jgi:hypothetical protein
MSADACPNRNGSATDPQRRHAVTLQANVNDIGRQSSGGAVVEFGLPRTTGSP